MGIESVKTKEFTEIKGSKSDSLKKGIIANFLNPSPYLFWATVGTPLIFKTHEISWAYTALFLASFYSMLFGSKVAIAIVVSRTKVFIEQKLYIAIMRVLCIALLAFSIYFFYDGLKYLKIA